MMLSNLSVIMAQRKIKIAELSKITGISRTTLTSLYYNSGNGVQFDTLNKLCEALRTTPGELLLYHPFEIIHVVVGPNTRLTDDLLVVDESNDVHCHVKIDGQEIKGIVKVQTEISEEFSSEDYYQPPYFNLDIYIPSQLANVFKTIPSNFEAAFIDAIRNEIIENRIFPSGVKAYTSVHTYY